MRDDESTRLTVHTDGLVPVEEGVFYPLGPTGGVWQEDGGRGAWKVIQLSDMMHGTPIYLQPYPGHKVPLPAKRHRWWRWRCKRGHECQSCLRRRLPVPELLEER